MSADPKKTRFLHVSTAPRPTERRGGGCVTVVFPRQLLSGGTSPPARGHNLCNPGSVFAGASDRFVKASSMAKEPEFASTTPDGTLRCGPYK